MTCVEDGPADLGAPLVLVHGLVWTDHVVLAYRAFDREGMIRHIASERSVGPVDLAGVGAVVHGEGQFDLGYHEGAHPPGCPDGLSQGTNTVAWPRSCVNRSLA